MSDAKSSSCSFPVITHAALLERAQRMFHAFEMSAESLSSSSPILKTDK